MPKKKGVLGRGRHQGSDWNSAWEIVSRLAAARDAALQEMAAPAGSQGAPAQPAQMVPTVRPPVAVELASAVAEIERAAAALRRTEPTLQDWHPERAGKREARRYRSVWILIG